MRNRRFLEVEELGTRLLPSVSPLALPAVIVPAALVAKHHHPLGGHGSGTYTGHSLVVDAGLSYTLKGTADLPALGHVTVKGSVNGVGLIQRGQASGTLTFANAHGSVTVELTGPVQTAFSALPEHFTYKVVKATGAFQHLTDHGTLALTFMASPVATAGPGIFPIGHGTFKLAIPK